MKVAASLTLRSIFMKNILTTVFAVMALATSGQSNSGVSVGLEQDILPYITGGYYANVWAGKNHLRARALVARARKPDFIIPDAFTNNKITAYALVGDYFPRLEWKGPWISGGLVRWNSSIQTVDQMFKVSFSNWLVNGSVGYNWKLAPHFYLSAWMGCHLLIAGPTTINVGPERYNAPHLNPEASIKVGWYF